MRREKCMGKICKVTYIKHSGVLVETDSAYLLFDYWEGKVPEIDSKKHLYVFASHVHHDHYSRDIFKLENACVNVDYILSDDIRTGSSDWKKAENVTFMDSDQETSVGDLRIKTLWSTDEGVAFLVKMDGLTVYHAGDLHWWYWPGDSDEENEGRRQREYKGEIAKIVGEKIDIAFVVLDPRQEYAGGYGMDVFLSSVGGRYVFPIHLWENYDYLKTYKAKNDSKYLGSRIMDISRQGECFEIEL